MRSPLRWKTRQPARCGTAAVEFALCLPLVLLFGLACGDFGRIVHIHLIVANASRTAAECGATHKFTQYTQAAWESTVYEAALAEMQNVPGFAEGQLDYELSTSIDQDGLSWITVGVGYPFRTAVAWPGLPSEVHLKHTAVFRQFR